MSWFDEQIKTRKLSDQEVFEDSFVELASSVLGNKAALEMRSDLHLAKMAIDEILKYYHKKPVEIPEEITSFEEQLEYALRPHGIMERVVKLTPGWYRDCYGPILAFDRESKVPVAILPDDLRGYSFVDLKSGNRTKISTVNEGLFEEDAYCFYAPLPLKELKIVDLLMYMKDCVQPGDVIKIVVISFIVTNFGILTTKLSKMVTGPVLESRSVTILVSLMIFMICANISSRLIGIINAQVTSRVRIKTSLSVEAAVMMRVMSLSARFFRKYSSGELSSRASSVNQLCDMLVTGLFNGAINSLMSLMYVGQIFSYAPRLVIPSLLIIAVTVGISLLSSFMQTGVSRKMMLLSAEESGLSYALLSGIQKIKVSGVEKRVFAKWAKTYAAEARQAYDPPMFLKINSVLNTAISLFGTIQLYYLAVKSGLDQSSYFAFNSAYGMATGAFFSLASILQNVAQIKPILEMAEPILKEVPENAQDKEVLTRISGNIEMSHVSFRYEDNTPYIVDDLSLKIRQGEYVALVGKTGCGKSTLIRLLLGFEMPEKGAIYYDGKDIKKIDLRSLRRKIGVVTQNGDLFNGDIFSNITICAPDLSLEEAWAAAETAGIAEDIRRMPMGMNTIISEGSRSISGGQKQRLMIARAIAPKPKVLIFDEATSALDNLTQKKIAEALDELNCTRIVIAHRLSTIRQCDRILVLDEGKIREEGTYDELISLNGMFAQLVERQRIDLEENREEEKRPE